ncbi:MAG TPA: TIGR03943 family protein [Actinomycetota bacterium]|nr:TIGR03943 family protein [Actinomycetota bacterium]
MRWNGRAIAITLALAAWAALFWFLMLSDRTFFYLSARTDWLVPVGAVVLSLATIGRAVSLRSPQAEPLKRTDAWSVGLIVLPVVLVLALPPASLSSFAAGRRSSFSSAGFTTSAEDLAEGELSFADVAGALRSQDSMEALVQRAGTEVTFTGFVTRDSGMPADEFVLTRFLISCCVADALSVEARVVGAPPGAFEKDEWVRVSGKFYPLGGEVILDAREVVKVPRPDKPYLNP